MNKRKKLTAAQVDSLRPYEKGMYTAVNSDWVRGVGEAGLRLMAGIHKEIAGGGTFINLSCPVCVLNLVRAVGKWYFEDKDDPATEEAPAPAADKPAKKRTPKKAK